MGKLLKSAGAAALMALTLTAQAQPERARDHSLTLGFDIDAVQASTRLGAWPDGGYSKLRFDESTPLTAGNRITLDYTGRLKPTLWARVIADYVDDASEGVDVTEAYLQWRPVPRSPNQHQLRIGAFYPALSFENSGLAWSSPYTLSFSAINTWLGEEIRPVGAEWRMQRRVGGPASRHRIGVFASAFYGNDPAATLLFWRGWSLHDRQTRLGDELDIPPTLAFGGSTLTLVPQSLRPITELDSRPGYYAGVDWTLARRVRMQLAHFDNRADVDAFRDGLWGWRTAFTTLGMQVGLPADLGLIAQWMGGATDWISRAQPDGTTPLPRSIVVDDFDAAFVLLTRTVRGKHRFSLRFDKFSIERPGSAFFGVSDDGHAQTLAYRYLGTGLVTLAAEWLRIDSARDVWSNAYGLPREQTEHQLRLRLSLKLEL